MICIAYCLANICVKNYLGFYSKEDGAKKVDVTRYSNIVGSLLFLTATRLEIVYVVLLVSRYMNEPSQIHLKAAKRI